MQTIIAYFQDFFEQVNKGFFAFCTLFAAILLFANYKWGIETKWIAGLPSRPFKFLAFYTVYLLAFGVPYLYYELVVREPQSANHSRFILLALLLLAPAIFALKVSAGGWQDLIRSSVPGNKGRFIAIVSDWPIRLVITVTLLTFVYLAFGRELKSTGHPLGLETRLFKLPPYLLLLALMIPLVAFAARQPSFLHAYPKLNSLKFLGPDGSTLWHKIMYALSYGSDFFTIEIFFRGFLVMAFARFAGPSAVLPMAVFYCSIHFGKPMLECVSSYFGGIILGVIAAYSHSIFGGILVHLGLAWMMELATLPWIHHLLKGR